ncbi:MAG: amidohydrolase family protein [Bacteroidales bacterium]|nr:amidohydrolase family protein [Bacteroidales bacterium]
MPILLKNATYINPKSLEFISSHIGVEEGTSGKISFHSEIPDKDKLKSYEIIDCKGMLVTKSFAIAHHHAYSALSRGMPPPQKTPHNFLEILKYIWWNIDKKLDKDMIRASALVTALACAKNGVTFSTDHHASPNCINNSLEIIAEAFDEVGISHLLCYEISDRDGKKIAEKGLNETKSYLESNQGLVGLHASFTVNDSTMKKAADLMNEFNSGIHIHVAEDLSDETDCEKKYGKRVIERLNDFGLLNSSKSILAHCIHLNDNERKIVELSKAYVVQNTESNLNNKVGFFNSHGLGNNIMIGTDGMHSDVLRSSKAAFFVGQEFDNITYLSAYERLRKVHNYLKFNNFKGDEENNLVVIDYDTPTEINSDNFLGHYIFGLESKQFRHVISSGKLIVKNYKIQTVDENEILSFSRIQGNRLFKSLLL